MIFMPVIPRNFAPLLSGSRRGQALDQEQRVQQQDGEKVKCSSTARREARAGRGAAPERAACPKRVLPRAQ